MKHMCVSVPTGDLGPPGAFEWAGGSPGEGLALRTSLLTSPPHRSAGFVEQRVFPGRGQALTCSWWPGSCGPCALKMGGLAE